MRALALLLVLLAGCGGCVSTPDYHATTSRIQIGRGSCSATAVGPSAILTAAHCFETNVPIIMVDGRIAHIAKFIRDGNDHILLKVDIGFASYATLGEKPGVGDSICLYGNPGALKDVYRCGMVAGKYQEETLYDIHGFYGDSGAGLFDRRGRLVGVVMGGFAWLNADNGIHFQIMRSSPLAFTDAQWREVL